MPFQIIRNDITKVKADVIVNSANPEPMIGGGTDSAIYEAAGKEELLAERKKIGKIEPGQAVVTSAFNLSAKYIIHTVGPVWVDGNHGERDILQSCYKTTLELARKLKAKSIAFPLISSGVYGFPKGEALDVATTVIGKYLLKHEMNIVLVVFDADAFEVSGQIFGKIKAYIDEHGVALAIDEEYGNLPNDPRRLQAIHMLEQYGPIVDKKTSKDETENIISSVKEQCVFKCRSGLFNKPVFSDFSDYEQAIESLMGEPNEMFSPTLLHLIEQKGFKKDSDCYKKANVSRQFFSRIRSDPFYRPKKQTVCAFALALKLNLKETEDLLEKAGYSLSHSWKFDLVVECCIVNHFYDVGKINEVLYKMKLPQLGSGMHDVE